MDRAEILNRFERWLDDVLSSEEPPNGIEADILEAIRADDPQSDGRSQVDDSYTLWAAMTALTHEVKLQGRAFKELSNTIAAQMSRAADDLRDASREREREIQRDTERRTRRETLGALIDLRDRLSRGLETVRAAQSENAGSDPWRWLTRVFSKSGETAMTEKLAALTKGYDLGLERLDQTLDELNAREIRCEGQPFDPRRMNAIDREESSAVPEGTVLEVYRSGYEWSGEVFRPAQVKVACAPASHQDE
jgi:molecular chaperone GrpE